MNAAEKAKSVDTASKIASVVNQFKDEFPDAKADLKPWANDQDTLELVDPDSIDIGFHFPGYSRRFQSRSILVQIRFHTDQLAQIHRAIGVELAGFDHRGKQWQLSTVHDWNIEGENAPDPDVQEKFRRFCRKIYELFNVSA
ncbi:MAG: hypothetical protein AAGA75_01645 [Cyanobacteria bacterium P01_E01_bin.6]